MKKLFVLGVLAISLSCCEKTFYSNTSKKLNLKIRNMTQGDKVLVITDSEKSDSIHIQVEAMDTMEAQWEPYFSVGSGNLVYNVDTFLIRGNYYTNYRFIENRLTYVSIYKDSLTICSSCENSFVFSSK
ncbi:hypothetical protein N9358_02020 [Flavobacteriales bacterium]|nr:hypothetical protein [Flavobacteriales bacterium]